MSSQKEKKQLAFNKSINKKEDVFLTALSGAISLSLQEKRRILEMLSSLSNYQVDSLLTIFEEEKEKFSTLTDVKSSEINQLIGRTKNDWKLLQKLYQLPDFTKPFLVQNETCGNYGLDELTQKSNKLTPCNPRFSPKELTNLASETIMGQTHAVKALANALYYHDLSRCHNIGFNDNPATPTVSQAPILMSGGSGTGKTHIIKSLAALMGIPTTIVDASSMVPSGVVGLSLGHIAKQVIDTAKGNIKSAEYSIVVLDEFDKLLTKHNGQEVLFQLLTAIEGTAPIRLNLDKDLGKNYPTSLQTNKMLFILAGSFSLQTEQKNSASMGFCAHNEESNIDQLFLKDISLPTEIRGRIGKIIHLEPMNNNALKEIFYKSPSSPLNTINQQLSILNCELNVKEETIEKILNSIECIELGARGLFQQFLSLPELEEVLSVAPEKLESVFHI